MDESVKMTEQEFMQNLTISLIYFCITSTTHNTKLKLHRFWQIPDSSISEGLSTR